MTKNAKLFDEYLKTIDVNLKFTDVEGETFVEMIPPSEGGIKARIGVIFNKNDSLVSIWCLNFIDGVNPSKRNQILDLINELNANYTYFKFVMINDSIQIHSDIPVDDNYSPAQTARTMVGMNDIMKKEYPNIMKTLWS